MSDPKPPPLTEEKLKAFAAFAKKHFNYGNKKTVYEMRPDDLQEILEFADTQEKEG